MKTQFNCVYEISCTKHVSCEQCGKYQRWKASIETKNAANQIFNSAIVETKGTTYFNKDYTSKKGVVTRVMRCASKRVIFVEKERS